MNESKIEKYKHQKNEHEMFVSGVVCALNLDSNEARDKFSLELSSSSWNDNGEKMYLVGYSGFYGSSDCSSRTTERMGLYFKKVVNSRMKEIMDEAIKLSSRDLEKTRLEAVDEANMVLNETKTTS